MLDGDLKGGTGASAHVLQSPMGTNGQAEGEISVAKALDLARQLEGIVSSLRVEAMARSHREDELQRNLVAFLVTDTMHHRTYGAAGSEHEVPGNVRRIIEADPDLCEAFWRALAAAECNDRMELGGDDDLPF